MSKEAFNLKVTINDPGRDAPEDWHVGAITQIAELIESGFTSGEVTLYDEVDYRIFWELKEA